MAPLESCLPRHREWALPVEGPLAGATAWASIGGGRHLIPPDGSMDLIVRWRADGSLFETFVSAPSRGAFSVLLDPRDRYAGLRLPPPLGFLFLGPPIDYATPGATPPSRLLHLGEEALRDPTRAPESVARDLARGLLSLNPPRYREVQRVERSWMLLRAGHSPGAALGESSWSDRAARRAFDRITGLSPRFLSTVARMERAGRFLAGGELALARIAVAAGFSDQAHMGRSLKSLTGLPAGEALVILAERYKTTAPLPL